MKLKYSDGYYVGQAMIFKKIRHGKGTYYFKNGDKYTGDFRHGKYEGTGTFTWADGESYTGGFSNGFRHGFPIGI